jgi:hypothetical protein
MVLQPIAERCIQPIKEDQPVREHVVVVLERGQETPYGQINPARLISMKLLILDVHLVDDLGKMRQARSRAHP